MFSHACVVDNVVRVKTLAQRGPLTLRSADNFQPRNTDKVCDKLRDNTATTSVDKPVLPAVIAENAWPTLVELAPLSNNMPTTIAY